MGSDTANIMNYPTLSDDQSNESDQSNDEKESMEASTNDEEESDTESIESDNESTNDDDDDNGDDDDEFELKDLMRQALSKHYPLFNHLVDEYRQDMSEEATIEKAESEMRKYYKQQFLKDYTDLLLTMHDLKYSKMHGKIKLTIKRLCDEEEFSPHEAIKYAVKRRKYMFDDLLDEVTAELQNREEDEEDAE